MVKKSKTIPVIAFIVIFFLLVTTALAQENGIRGGFGYFFLEGNSIDSGELNSSLKSHGYNRISDNFIGIGAGGHQRRNMFILYDGHAVWYFPRKAHSTVGDIDYITSLNGFYGVYNFGYVIYEKNDLTVFPLVGVGFGALKMRIERKSKQSFGEILDNPQGNRIDTQGISIFNFAVATKKLLRIKEGRKSDRYLMFEFRAGYRLCPGKNSWENISGGPNISLSGPYILVMFGGGHMTK